MKYLMFFWSIFFHTIGIAQRTLSVREEDFDSSYTIHQSIYEPLELEHCYHYYQFFSAYVKKNKIDTIVKLIMTNTANDTMITKQIFRNGFMTESITIAKQSNNEYDTIAERKFSYSDSFRKIGIQRNHKLENGKRRMTSEIVIFNKNFKLEKVITTIDGSPLKEGVRSEYIYDDLGNISIIRYCFEDYYGGVDSALIQFEYYDRNKINLDSIKTPNLFDTTSFAYSLRFPKKQNLEFFTKIKSTHNYNCSSPQRTRLQFLSHGAKNATSITFEFDKKQRMATISNYQKMASSVKCDFLWFVQDLSSESYITPERYQLNYSVMNTQNFDSVLSFHKQYCFYESSKTSRDLFLRYRSKDLHTEYLIENYNIPDGQIEMPAIQDFLKGIPNYR